MKSAVIVVVRSEASSTPFFNLATAVASSGVFCGNPAVQAESNVKNKMILRFIGGGVEKLFKRDDAVTLFVDQSDQLFQM